MQDLQPVRPAITVDEEVPAEGVALHEVLGEHSEVVEGAAHVAGRRAEGPPGSPPGSSASLRLEHGQHRSQRRSLLFGGDTAYTERLPATTNGRPLYVALLPIGGYNPHIANHAIPEQAWDLYHEMRARYLIPMHWRTFRMSRQRPFEPYERLTTAVNGSASRIALHTIGETWSLPRIFQVCAWMARRLRHKGSAGP